LLGQQPAFRGMTPAFFCGKHLLALDHGLLRDTTF
jgi:hypothetical protein